MPHRRIPGRGELSIPNSQLSTRQRLIAVAADLFLRRGYEATGVAEILAGAGVGAGSFYYHFQGKEDLLLAVLDHHAEGLADRVVRPAREGTPDPVERVFAILDSYRRELIAGDFERGCPVGNLALEVANRLPAARARTAGFFDRWRGEVLTALTEAGPRLPGELDRAGLAALVLAVMEGGVLQARAARSVEPFDAAVAGLRDYVGRLLAAEGRRPAAPAPPPRPRRRRPGVETPPGGQRVGEGAPPAEPGGPQDSWKVW
jgi:TetR/AcrR family transcriptional regulator, transcriptional repressor for nem operon